MNSKEDDVKVEPEIVATAVPTGGGGAAKPSGGEPPIPAGHSRFYCNKCHTVR